MEDQVNGAGKGFLDFVKKSAIQTPVWQRHALVTNQIGGEEGQV